MDEVMGHGGKITAWRRERVNNVVAHFQRAIELRGLRGVSDNLW
jgi:hypothetical protein